MKEITPRQETVLCFIALHIEQKGYPPSLSEFTEGFAVSTRYHLKALLRKGYIEITSGANRSIKLTEQARQFLSERSRTIITPAEHGLLSLLGWTTQDKAA